MQWEARIKVRKISKISRAISNITLIATDAGMEEAISKTAEETLSKMGFSQHSNAGQLETGFASSVVSTLEEKTLAEQQQESEGNDNAIVRNQTIDEGYLEESNSVHYQNGGSTSSNLLPHDGLLSGAPANAKSLSIDKEALSRSSKSDVSDEEQAPLGARATMRDNRGKSRRKNAWTVPTTKPQVGPQDFEDPISDAFWKNIWVASAAHNVGIFLRSMAMLLIISCLKTEIYRKVFHAIPDDHVSTWKQYKEFIAHHDRLSKPVSLFDCSSCRCVQLTLGGTDSRKPKRRTSCAHTIRVGRRWNACLTGVRYDVRDEQGRWRRMPSNPSE